MAMSYCCFFKPPNLSVRQEVRTPCERYNSNTDSLRTVSWIEIEVVSKSDGTQQCERVIMSSTAGYIVVVVCCRNSSMFSIWSSLIPMLCNLIKDINALNMKICCCSLFISFFRPPNCNPVSPPQLCRLQYQVVSFPYPLFHILWNETPTVRLCRY
jgi:hypothetical protein